DVLLDFAPVELWVVFHQVGRTVIAEFLGNSVLDKLSIQRVQLSQVERIGQLPDKVGGPDQAGFSIGLCVILVIRDGKRVNSIARAIRSSSMSETGPKRSRTMIFDRST